MTELFFNGGLLCDVVATACKYHFHDNPFGKSFLSCNLADKRNGRPTVNPVQSTRLISCLNLQAANIA